MLEAWWSDPEEIRVAGGAWVMTVASLGIAIRPRQA